jgi:hypothetical protein
LLLLAQHHSGLILFLFCFFLIRLPFLLWLLPNQKSSWDIHSAHFFFRC